MMVKMEPCAIDPLIDDAGAKLAERTMPLRLIIGAALAVAAASPHKNNVFVIKIPASEVSPSLCKGEKSTVGRSR
jgi:hypothetical protein